MKKTFPILPALVLLLAGACSKNSGGGGVKLRNDTDSVAYVIGMNVGANLLKMDSTINVNAVCEGIRDMFRGNPRLSAADAETFYLSYVNYALPEKARAYEEPVPPRHRQVEPLLCPHVVGRDLHRYGRRGSESGSHFRARQRGPAVGDPHGGGRRDHLLLRAGRYGAFAGPQPAARVQESVKLIGKGGKINAWMPSSAAYGAEGDKELGVAPNATLYFEIELVDLDKYTTRSRRR